MWGRRRWAGVKYRFDLLSMPGLFEALPSKWIRNWISLNTSTPSIPIFLNNEDLLYIGIDISLHTSSTYKINILQPHFRVFHSYVCYTSTNHIQFAWVQRLVAQCRIQSDKRETAGGDGRQGRTRDSSRSVSSRYGTADAIAPNTGNDCAGNSRQLFARSRQSGCFRNLNFESVKVFKSANCLWWDCAIFFNF